MTPIPVDIPALTRSLYSILPEIVVVATALCVLFADLFTSEKNRGGLCVLSLLGVAVALFLTFALRPVRIEGFSGMVVNDGLGAFFGIVILCACGLTLLMATGYSEWEGTDKGEFYALLLLS